MTAPKPPLCKGRWHGEAVTKGLCSTQRQIGMQQCASVKSTRIAVGEGFYPSRRYNVVNSLAPTRIRMRRNVYVFDGASRAGGVEPRPYADLVDSTRSPMVHTILLLPAAQSLSRLRRQHPYPLCPFGAFPPDRGNRPFTQGSLWCVPFRIGASKSAILPRPYAAAKYAHLLLWHTGQRCPFMTPWSWQTLQGRGVQAVRIRAQRSAAKIAARIFVCRFISAPFVFDIQYLF